MSSTQATGEHALASPPTIASLDMKLEVVVIPVSDIDRAKRFYEGLGWRVDADISGGDGRVVQLTPPASPCSIHLRQRSHDAPGVTGATRPPASGPSSRAGQTVG